MPSSSRAAPAPKVELGHKSGTNSRQASSSSLSGNQRKRVKPNPIQEDEADAGDDVPDSHLSAADNESRRNQRMVRNRRKLSSLLSFTQPSPMALLIATISA